MRPAPAAERTSKALVALGHQPILAPMLAIEDIPNPIPDGDFAAVLATSANGLTRLAKRPEIATLRRLPLVAVGDRTAAAGREAGFETVHVAEGDGLALFAEVRARFADSARLLHAAGQDRAFDLAGALGRHGYAVEVLELYRAVAATELPVAAQQALGEARDGGLAALHHSRRIAETFLTLSDAAGFASTVRSMPHGALAARVAEPLRLYGCANVETAGRPDEASLFEALMRLMD